MKEIIQYLPLRNARASYRFLKRLNQYGVMTILDLEDSSIDPFDSQKTKELKRESRLGLMSIIEKYSWDFNQKIYIRINSINSDCYQDDINLVKKIKKMKIPITGVFLPKVESYSQVLNLNSFFKEDELEIEIIPMIETLKGVLNFRSILKEDTDKLIKRIHYGHYDYCSDAKLWPFPEPNNFEFWELVKPLVETLTEFERGFVQSPFSQINNEILFWQARDYLKKIAPAIETWSCSLNTETSMSVRDENLEDLKLEKLNSNVKELLLDAQDICKCFMAGYEKKRYYGVSNNRIISPHQYHAANNFISKQEAEVRS